MVGSHAGRASSWELIRSSWTHGDSDPIEPGQKPLLGGRVEIEMLLESVGRHGLALQIDADLGRRVRSHLDETGDRTLAQLDDEETDKARVVAKDVGRRGGDDRLETPLLDRPRGVLT